MRFGCLLQYWRSEKFDGYSLKIRVDRLAVDRRCHRWQNAFLKKSQEVEPFEMRSLQAPVIEVVAINIDACPKQCVSPK